MTYTIDTPLVGRGHGDPDKIADYLIERGAMRGDDLRSYLHALYMIAPRVGINPDVAVAQFIVETSDRLTGQKPGVSVPWIYGLNPAGLGVTDDSQWRVYDFKTGTRAAIAQLAHLGLYAGVAVPDDMAALDPRWGAAVHEGRFGVAPTLDGLANMWAKDPDYAEKIASRLNQLNEAGLLEDIPLATTSLHVLLVAGHNSVGDGGNPVERNLTPNLAKAYLAAFKAAGIPVEYVNPTLTPGGLDGLASLTARKIRDTDAKLVVALDLHFNGSRSGVHVIPAHNRKSNGGTLSTAIIAGRVAADTMDNNTLDVTFAGSLARAIVAANPGMTLWGATGIMPESQTGVGLQGYRLAMMAYSAPHRDKSIRVTVEHGGTNDAQREDFYERCANAAVATVKTVLGTRIDVPPPGPDPDPPPDGGTGNPSLASFLFGEAAGYVYDPNGPVSTFWLEEGNLVGHYPRLIDVLIEDTRKLFVFADGTVIVAEPGKPVAHLDHVDA